MSALARPALRRLSPDALGRLPAEVAVPGYDRSRVGVGIVHFGPGAFHRAHQACYVDDLLAHDPRWGIAAVSLRTPGVRDALAPQDGLYTVAELDARVRFRVVGALKEVLVAADAPDAVLARLAAPTTEAVTLTVTEKGYCLDEAGALDLAHPDVRHDLDGPAAPRSVPGWLAAGLRRRRDAGLAPFTTISCDNLTDNGERLRRAVVALAGERDPALARWIEAEAAFPCTMVDSITPATDDALRARTAEALGVEDAWPIQRERFVQWVIERVEGAPGPDWAAAGAILTCDVRGWEQAKLRLLNGAHSTLAYLGLLAGRETVAEAMADPALAGFVRALMLEEVAPTLTPPPGLDLAAYVAEVLERFRNPAVRHRLSQIAWDGSQKLPFRLLGTTADALAAGAPLDRFAVAIAGWMRFVRRQARARVALVDPLADRLAAIGHACTGDAADDVVRFLSLSGVFPPALAAAPRFREALTTAYAKLGDDDWATHLSGAGNP